MLLKAKTRERIGKGLSAVRGEGLIPAVVYGRSVEARSISVPENIFLKVYRTAGESQLVDLEVEESSPVKVLIHDVSFHPLTGKVLHVDFHQVSMTEKLTAEVPLHFVGESRAMKEFGGVLIKTMNSVEVECLPQDLPQFIEVSLGGINELGASMHIRDIKVQSGVTIKAGADDVVATVIAPRSEEELAKLEEKVEINVEAVKVASEEKKAERAKEKENEEEKK